MRDMNPLPLLPPLGRVVPAQPPHPVHRERAKDGERRRNPRHSPPADGGPPPQGDRQQHINDYARGVG